MAYAPDLITNFVNANAPYQSTSGPVLSNLAELITQRKNEKAAAEKEAAWQEGLGAFMRERSYETGIALYNANPEKWADFSEADATMTEMEQTQRVQKNMEYIALLETDPPGATELLTQERDANLAEKDFEEAEALDDLIKKVENGQASEVSTLLQLRSLGMGDIGQNAMKSVLENAENRRAENDQLTDFIESGVGLEFASTEHKNRVLIEANKMKNPALARMYAEMGSIAGGDDEGKLTGTTLADYAFKTNKMYNDRIENYRTASDAAATIYAAEKPNSGFSDDAILKLFNKVLDPDSVVRQSELEATLEAQGKLEEFKNLLPKWGTGVTLNETTRPKLLEIVELIDESSQEKVKGIQKEMNPLVDRFMGEENRPLIYGPVEDAVENVKKDVEAQSEAKLNAIRASLRKLNEKSTGDIENMSIAEMQAAYPNSFPVAAKAVPSEVGTTVDIGGETFEVLE